MITIIESYYNNTRYLKTNIDPNSLTGFNIIAKNVVLNTLNDCQPSTLNDSNYGLQSESLGRIHVKCDELITHRPSWSFRDLNKPKINYYFLLAFDKNRTEILHVWKLPANAPILRCGKIRVYERKDSLKRLKEYEIDSSVFNEEYCKLNVAYIPEFENYLPDECTATCTL